MAQTFILIHWPLLCSAACVYGILVNRNPTTCLSFFCFLLQMMSNIDGHSWALCAFNEDRPTKIFSPLNKEQIPITDSPVVVQQHNIPPQKFVLLSAKVKNSVTATYVAYVVLILLNFA